jgi:GT2 family glycosyltransferase
MNSREAEVIIICPSLSVIDAARTIYEARNSAGMPAAVILASDHERRGAVKVGNVMIRAALDWGAKYVCYLNDDTHGFPQGWLKRLVEVVGSRPDYGIAVPGCPCRTAPQNTGRPGMKPGVTELARPSAWVVAVIKAFMFQELGLLDEALIHYADDSDFEMRMFAAGYKSVWVHDVFVGHDAEPGEVAAPEWWAHDAGVFKRKWR